MLALAGLVAVTLGPIDVQMSDRTGCPSASAIAIDIERLIGTSSVPQVDVRLELRDTAEGVVGELEYTVAGRVQTRTIPGSSCAEVANAVAVVVAVGVDPVAVQRTVQPILQRPTLEPPPLPPPPALPSTTEDPEAVAQQQPGAPLSSRSEVALEPRPRRRRRPWLGAFARGGVGVGGLPAPMGWVGGGLQLGLGGLRVELSGQHLLAQQIQHPEDESTGADVALTSGRAAGCWTPRVGAFTLGGCAGGDVGAARGSGFGLEEPGTASTLWVAVTPGLRAHWHPTPRIAVGLALDVPVSVVRPRLRIDDFDSPLVEVGVTGVFAGLSVGFTFFDGSGSRRR